MNILTVVGGNLFRIALETLGDATQWDRIAAINNLSDPVLEGLTVLKIPTTDPQSGEGFASTS